MIPLVAPSYGDLDIALMAEAVRAGALDVGSIAHRFEGAVADLVGGVRGQGTPSGTASLHLALLAAGVTPEHEVITPSYTCIAVLHAIHLVGARPVLVDNLDEPSELDFNIDPERALAACGPRTGAIVVPHAFGVTADVTALATSGGAPVIEDCAMSLGSARGGTRAGSLGQFATFSFHSTKVISTGAGGMVVATDGDAAEALSQANCYLDEQREHRTMPVEAVRGSYSYSCGYQLTDPQAALGLAQLKRLPGLIERRCEIARWYNQELGTSGARLPTNVRDGGFPFRYQLDLGSLAIAPVEAIAALAERGVEAGRGVYPALHQYLGLDATDFPRATRCTAEMLSLPVHPALSDSEVEAVVAACLEVLT